MSEFKTGCLPYKYDPRDYQLKDHRIMDNVSEDLLNKSFDLRDEYMPEVYHQKHGSCTAQSVVASYAYQMNRIYGMIGAREDTNYSTRFTYLMSRYLTGDLNEDKGATIMDACKSTVKYGLAQQRVFPNDGDIFEKPDFFTWAWAANNKANAYYQLSKNEDLLIQILNLLDHSIPVIIGLNSYYIRDVDGCGLSNRSNREDGKIMPSTHAMLLVGRLTDFDYYGERKNVFVIRNSWGKNWGDNGYIYIPEEQGLRYIIKEAAVLFKDDLGSDEENCNYMPTVYGQSISIPKNSIILGNLGYSKDYFEYIKSKDENKFKREYEELINNYPKVLIKNEEGEWRNYRHENIEKPDLSFPIVYTTKYGYKYSIK